MTTQKNKVQGYVDRHCFEAFTTFWQENQLSQSQALEHLLNRALGLVQDVPKSSPLEERVTKLEDELLYLKNQLLVMRGEHLQNRSNLNGNLADEPLLISEVTKLVSPPVEQDEPEVIQSNLDGDIPDSAEDHLYMVWRYSDSNPDFPHFWKGKNPSDFTFSFKSAKRYKLYKVARQRMTELLQNDQRYTDGWNIRVDSVASIKKWLTAIRDRRSNVVPK